MKKNVYYIPEGAPLRRGFALILTLSVLSVIIALTAILIGYMDSARRDAQASNAMIQANLYFADVKKVLSRFKQRKNLYNTLYLAPIPLSTPDGRFSVMLSCKPQDNGVNINWLALEESRNMEAHYEMAHRLLEALSEQYELKDPARLEEILVESIKKGGTGVDGQSLLRQKNGIISYRQFEQVVERYQFEIDDKRVSRIPWQRFFTFTRVSKNPKENLIAGDYLSKPLLAILFGIDMATLNESWEPSSGALKKLLSENGIDFDSRLFASDFVNRSECTVNYKYAGKSYQFKFFDRNGEVNHFEFFGK